MRSSQVSRTLAPAASPTFTALFFVQGSRGRCLRAPAPPGPSPAGECRPWRGQWSDAGIERVGRKEGLAFVSSPSPTERCRIAEVTPICKSKCIQSQQAGLRGGQVMGFCAEVILRPSSRPHADAHSPRAWGSRTPGLPSTQPPGGRPWQRTWVRPPEAQGFGNWPEGLCRAETMSPSDKGMGEPQSPHPPVPLGARPKQVSSGGFKPKQLNASFRLFMSLFTQ